VPPGADAIAADAEPQLAEAARYRNNQANEDPAVNSDLVNPCHVHDRAEEDDIVHHSHQVHAYPRVAATTAGVLAASAALENSFDTAHLYSF